MVRRVPKQNLPVGMLKAMFQSKRLLQGAEYGENYARRYRSCPAEIATA